MPTHTQHHLVTRTHFRIHESSSIDLKILFKTKLLLTDKRCEMLTRIHIYTSDNSFNKRKLLSASNKFKINPEGN